MASQKRTLRIGQYGSNTGLREFIENSPFNQSITQEQLLITMSREQKDRFNTIRESPLQRQRATSVLNEMNNNSRTINYSCRRLLLNQAAAERSSISPVNQFAAIHSSYSIQEPTHRQSVTSTTPSSGSRASPYGSRRLHNQDGGNHAHLPDIIRGKSSNNSSSQYQDEEKKLQRSNANIFSHLKDDRATRNFMVNLRGTMFKSRAKRTSSPTSTTIVPFSDSIHDSSNYMIKSAKDTIIHYEKFMHLHHKRIGSPVNLSQIAFDTNLRQYSREFKGSRDQELSWMAPSARNVSFDAHDDSTFDKRVEKSKKRGTVKKRQDSIAYLDYPGYSDKLERRDYQLQRLLRRDASPWGKQDQSQLREKTGDICQSSLKWQLSLKAYSKHKQKKGGASTQNAIQETSQG